MTNSDPVVSFSDLEVGYGRNVVLHDISAKITTGECVAITGNNGSGKSTLIKAIMGIEDFQRGSIDVLGYVRQAGRPPKGTPPWMEVGYVPQRLTAVGGVDSSVLEVVRSGLLGYRRLWPPRDWRQRVLAALDQVGLAHRQKEPFGILSGGQAQRALIARALVREPQLMILDEPLTGLDAHNRERLAGLLTELKVAGTTSMIVLHEMGELAPLITRELRLSAGHISHDGPCTHRHHREEDSVWIDIDCSDVKQGAHL